jgi:hypothetical protein
MKCSKSKWPTYTFFVGLIPVFTRLPAWSITRTGAVSPLTASDFGSFGLVLHISIINELEHISSVGLDGKTAQNGVSLIAITLYGVLYSITTLGERSVGLVDAAAMLRISMAFAVRSALLSISMVHHLSKLS